MRIASPSTQNILKSSKFASLLRSLFSAYGNQFINNLKMTVPYNAMSKKFIRCSSFHCIIKALHCSISVATAKFKTLIILIFTRWKGSVWKLLWMPLLAFLSVFYLLTFIRLVMLPDNLRKTFELFILSSRKYEDLVPMGFVLGFFVSRIMTR